MPGENATEGRERYSETEVYQLARRFVPILAVVLLAGCGSAVSPHSLYTDALGRLPRQPNVNIVAHYDYFMRFGDSATTTVRYQAPNRLSFQDPERIEPMIQVGHVECLDGIKRSCAAAGNFNLLRIAGDLLLPAGRVQGGSIFDTADASLHTIRFLHARTVTSGKRRVMEVTIEALGYPWSCDPAFDCLVSVTALRWRQFRYHGLLTIDAATHLPLTYRAGSHDMTSGRVLQQTVSFTYGRHLSIHLP